MLPIVNIYRKYYGPRMTAFLALTFYVAMAGGALVVEAVLGVPGLIPRERTAQVVEASITLSYTSLLTLAFLALAAILVWRYLRTGGREMLAMMNMTPDEMSGVGAWVAARARRPAAEAADRRTDLACGA